MVQASTQSNYDGPSDKEFQFMECLWPPASLDFFVRICNNPQGCNDYSFHAC